MDKSVQAIHHRTIPNIQHRVSEIKY